LRRHFVRERFYLIQNSFTIGKHTIHEAETAHGFGWLSLAEILEVSSNIGTTKVAFSVGEDGFKQMIGDMGFGMKTGIDFPGEATGIVTPGHWQDHLLSNVSFGHGVGVTAIQMATVYSAIANGGKLMRPFIVKNVRDPEGRLVEEKKPEVRRQILTAKEASLLTMMLSGVTEAGGTGTLARVDGYPVAGKTGTAQKVNPHGKGYLPHAYVASFIGFVPANNPQFTIYVVVDNPRRQFFGAQVAAPSFNHLASFALHQRGFMPIFMTENGGEILDRPTWVPKKLNRAVAKLSDQDHVPDFSGLTVREVSQLLNKYNLAANRDVELVGSGVASNQWPVAGQVWSKKLRVLFKPQE
jgi:cell division protein FtsI (penicillin-binding protein 3)